MGSDPICWQKGPDLAVWVCGDVRVEGFRRSLVSAPDGVRLRGAARQSCQRSIGISAKRARQVRTTKEYLRADRPALRRSHARAWNIPPEHPRAPTHVEREDPSASGCGVPPASGEKSASPKARASNLPCGSDLSQPEQTGTRLHRSVSWRCWIAQGRERASERRARGDKRAATLWWFLSTRSFCADRN